MALKSFDGWLSEFRESISSYDYYVDFEKVYRNLDNIKIELNILNSLIGEKDIEQKFLSLLDKYPEVLKCIPILLAVRQYEIFARDDVGDYKYNFKVKNVSPEQYSYFMKATGLYELLSNHIINNLVDYVCGVEVGLDSNGRKNRGGHLMEDLVEEFIKATGKEYYKEMYVTAIEEKWGVNLSSVSSQGKATKRFDFVVKTENQIYVFETNFYAGGGSKLNETARSYKMLSQQIEATEGVTFIWITDGIGWKSARRNLEQTFDVMDTIFNINELENGVLSEILL